MMTTQEIQFILEQTTQAIELYKYKEAEILLFTVLNSDLSNLNFAEEASLLPKANRLLAFTFLRRGLLEESLPFAQKAVALSYAANDKMENAKALNLLGTLKSHLSENQEAIECIQQAMTLYRDFGTSQGIAESYLNLGLVYYKNSQYSVALECYENALEEFRRRDLKLQIALSLSNIGVVHHLKSDYSKALDYYLQSVSIHRENGNMRSVALVSGNIGNVYRDIADYHNALEYYKKAVSIFDEYGLVSNTALILGNIGITYRNLLDYPRAIEYLEKSVAIHEEHGLFGGVAMFLGNIGITYSQMRDSTQAIKYLEKAYRIYQDLKLDLEAALFVSNLGLEYYLLENYEQALKYSEDALPILKTGGRKEEATGTMRTIGLVYASPDYSGFDPQRAEEYLLSVITTYEEIKAKLYLYQSHQHLANLYKQQKRWEEYSEHIEKYHQLYIEVQNEEVKKQADRFGWERKIADMEKQKEIEAIKTCADKRLLEETISFQKQSLEQQAREVKNTVDELVRKNSLLQLIQSDLKKIAPQTKREGTDYIDQLLERVTRNITPLESNQQLDKQLTEVHGEFISNLHQKFPDLTTMELKIAALLTMKLTSSNIAAALFLAKRTVESHRFSIRKKMGLGTSDDIYSELAKYSA